MATSSITENIRINNSNTLEEYVTAMEKDAKDSYVPKKPHSNVCTDRARMNAFMEKALSKRGDTL